MSTLSKIEWTDRTWNPVRGCAMVSPGCTNCYAMTQAHRFDFPHGPYEGLTRMTEHGAVWSGKIRLVPEALEQPLRWKKPARVFVNSMSDLFHEGVPFAFTYKVFCTMQEAKRHTFQILTKRPQSMRDFITKAAPVPAMTGMKWGEDYKPRNIWLGVSVENQATADKRIPILLQTPAAVRFLSVEPLLEYVSLNIDRDGMVYRYLTDSTGRGIDWVIIGGESGRNARPCNIEWIRSIVAQCKAAGVPVFVKQLGLRACFEAHHQGEGQRCYVARLRDPKGGDPAEWPEDLRVREFPAH